MDEDRKREEGEIRRNATSGGARKDSVPGKAAADFPAGMAKMRRMGDIRRCGVTPAVRAATWRESDITGSRTLVD